MEPKETSTLETTDIILTAYLLLEGARLGEISKVGARGTFNLTNVPVSAVEAFDLGMALVEPTAFNMKIKQLTTAVRRMA